MLYEIKSVSTGFLNETIALVQHYLTKHNLQVDKALYCESKKGKEVPAVIKLMDSLAENDAVLVAQASILGCSVIQVLKVLDHAVAKNIAIHFCKYDVIFSQRINNRDLLTLLYEIASEFVVIRTKLTIAKRREAGLAVGRPKGSNNKKLKLDKHKQEIKRYLDLKVSRASIAKLLNCHPQTVENYIRARSLANLRARKKVQDALTGTAAQTTDVIQNADAV